MGRVVEGWRDGEVRDEWVEGWRGGGLESWRGRVEDWKGEGVCGWRGGRVKI